MTIAKGSRLPEDINDDGVVDILDLSLVAEAFGSYSQHERWNPDADVDANGKINIVDASMVCLKFGVAICPLFGDLNSDGLVDIKDLAIIAKALGSFPGHPRWNIEADLNHDNLVNIQDMILAATHFGETCI